MSENSTNAEDKKIDSIITLNPLEEQLGQPVSTSYITTTNVTTSKTNNTFSKKLQYNYFIK
jgi:hypothetical protein